MLGGMSGGYPCPAKGSFFCQKFKPYHLLSHSLPHKSCAAAQIDRCFGFETAVEEAQRALLAAKVPASTPLALTLGSFAAPSSSALLTCRNPIAGLVQDAAS